MAILLSCCTVVSDRLNDFLITEVCLKKSIELWQNICLHNRYLKTLEAISKFMLPALNSREHYN